MFFHFKILSFFPIYSSFIISRCTLKIMCETIIVSVKFISDSKEALQKTCSGKRISV